MKKNDHSTMARGFLMAMGALWLIVAALAFAMPAPAQSLDAKPRAPLTGPAVTTPIPSWRTGFYSDGYWVCHLRFSQRGDGRKQSAISCLDEAGGWYVAAPVVHQYASDCPTADPIGGETWRMWPFDGGRPVLVTLRRVVGADLELSFDYAPSVLRAVAATYQPSPYAGCGDR